MTMIEHYFINLKLGRRCFMLSIENSKKSFVPKTIFKKKSFSSAIIKTILSKIWVISICSWARSVGEKVRRKRGKICSNRGKCINIIVERWNKISCGESSKWKSRSVLQCKCYPSVSNYAKDNDSKNRERRKNIIRRCWFVIRSRRRKILSISNTIIILWRIRINCKISIRIRLELVIEKGKCREISFRGNRLRIFSRE